MNRKIILFIGMSLWLCLQSWAQISIMNANVSAYNITPQGLCQFNIMNNGAEMKASLSVNLSNANGENLLRVQSKPFTLKSGLNSVSGYSLELSPAEFSTAPQGQYLLNTHTLPSGKFTVCCTMFANGIEPLENYCEDIESDMTAFLNLISPSDKDVIETTQPVLVWTHNEPFNLLTPGEYFRMIVVEKEVEQSAEAAVSANAPIWMKDYVGSHQLQYPIDAKQLIIGKTYAWQVQKISNASIIKKTEAWEFKLAQIVKSTDIKYAVLKDKPEAGYYGAVNGKLYFKFEEAYSGNTFDYFVYNSKSQLVSKDVVRDGATKEERAMPANVLGNNQFMIDTDKANMKKGMYTLVVSNDKGKQFILNFIVE
jgi:hypothetical protein